MIRPFTAVNAKGIPIPFYVDNAIIDSISIDEAERAVVFNFTTGFYKLDRDGKNPHPLASAKMYIYVEEGYKVLENMLIARRVHIFRRVKFKRFRKNVLKKKMIVNDILYSHHSDAIVIEGTAKGHFAVQINHVDDVRFSYYELHDVAYDSTIVNRRDVFQFKKPE